MNYQQPRSKIVIDGSPDHDAAATESVTFHNTTVCISLAVVSIYMNPTVIMEQIEPRFITEDDVIPVGTSLVDKSKIKPYLPKTSSKYRSMIRSTATNTEFSKSS